ncbi:hypothetical protein ONZ45_g6027 [Pleurotus djamor]|nr:hypothetical protein ONZ45_g6027 [Pleurotus djamor]
MRATSISNLAIVVIMMSTTFTSFAVGFSTTSKPVHVSSDVGELAFQENIDAGNCMNQGERLAAPVGKCDPANSKGFYSGHNCKNHGGKYYYCITQAGAFCVPVKSAMINENGECF